jgi:hypothetical protein
MTSPTCTTYHILNLGAGVQSTTLYLMFMRGEIQPHIDYAIFADTQEEPQAVYRHLAWLQSLGGPPILVRTAGKLGDNLTPVKGKRWTFLPNFMRMPDGSLSRAGRRGCTSTFKVEVVQRAIREDVLGLRRGQRWPLGVVIHGYYGISLDEARRSTSIRERCKTSRAWETPHFPLIDKFMTRADCTRWLQAFPVPHVVPKSACTFCPFHDDRAWETLKETDPEGWARAIQIERLVQGNGLQTRMGIPYLHRSCKPLAEIDFRRVEPTFPLFALECEGMCGV